MDYFKKIIKINHQDFLISSVMKLGNNYNILGFSKTKTGWSRHIICVTLTEEEFKAAIKTI